MRYTHWKKDSHLRLFFRLAISRLYWYIYLFIHLQIHIHIHIHSRRLGAWLHLLTFKENEKNRFKTTKMPLPMPNQIPIQWPICLHVCIHMHIHIHTHIHSWYLLDFIFWLLYRMSRPGLRQQKSFVQLFKDPRIFSHSAKTITDGSFKVEAT